MLETVKPCSVVARMLIDPIAYSSTAKRLTTNGAYCVYDSYLNECETNTVVYSTTAKRLVRYQEAIAYGGYCSNINAVSYNSSTKRLVYQATGSTGCF